MQQVCSGSATLWQTPKCDTKHCLTNSKHRHTGAKRSVRWPSEYAKTRFRRGCARTAPGDLTTLPNGLWEGSPLPNRLGGFESPNLSVGRGGGFPRESPSTLPTPLNSALDYPAFGAQLTRFVKIAPPLEIEGAMHPIFLPEPRLIIVNNYTNISGIDGDCRSTYWRVT